MSAVRPVDSTPQRRAELNMLFFSFSLSFCYKRIVYAVVMPCCSQVTFCAQPGTASNSRCRCCLCARAHICRCCCQCRTCSSFIINCSPRILLAGWVIHALSFISSRLSHLLISCSSNELQYSVGGLQQGVIDCWAQG